MADTYVYLIREEDWDSDSYLDPAAQAAAYEGDDSFAAHAAFAQAVEELGLKMVGGKALQNRKYGGSVTPGSGDRKVEDAVYSDAAYADTSEVITGFYMVEVEDEDQARKVAALVPTGNRVEWRKVFAFAE
jgi:hypothetical protein